MAIKATIYKLKIEINDCDRNYFHSHDLIISCHPSETEGRMMVRVLAFALYASEQLNFTKGLCADDEPDLWEKSLSGEIKRWISLGQIEKKQLRKSLGRSKQVVIFTYAGNKSSLWWQKNQLDLKKSNHLDVFNIKPDDVDAMQALVARTMELQCTIQEGIIWLSNANQTINIVPQIWQSN